MCNLSHDLLVYQLYTSLFSQTAINMMHISVFEEHSGNILGLWFFIVFIELSTDFLKDLQKQEYL